MTHGFAFYHGENLQIYFFSVKHQKTKTKNKNKQTKKKKKKKKPISQNMSKGEYNLEIHFTPFRIIYLWH